MYSADKKNALKCANIRTVSKLYRLSYKLNLISVPSDQTKIILCASLPCYAGLNRKKGFSIKSLKDLFIRSQHTKSLSNLDTPLKLNPLFITGFTDGEGSFSISIRDLDKDTKKGRVLYVFSIGLHKKDEGILKSIQYTLGIGKIYGKGKEGVQFRVESKKELLILIEHFDKYPLITKKGKDFMCFKKAIFLIKNKEHLTEEGLLKLVSLKALMGKGLTNELKPAFPYLVSENELGISDLTLSQDLIIDPNWLAGFISAEGCFIISIFKSTSVKTGFQVQLRFVLSQHIRDKELFEYFVKYLGFGRIAVNREAVEFIVNKFSDLKDKLLPILHLQHPIVGYKYLDYLYFMEAVEMMEKKSHLTDEGLNKFREIQRLMNSGRENTPSEDTDSGILD